MTLTATIACIAFEGGRRLAAGSVADVAAAMRKRTAQASHQPILVFDYTTGQPLHLDLRGTEKDIRARYAEMPPATLAAVDDSPSDVRRGPGRPKLGVVPREVTLLPRHWDWLNAQPGGASVALRKLVEEARRTRGRSDALRARQEATYRFISAIAGDWRNYDDANRALFANDAQRFDDLTESWPADVRDHARHLAFAPRNA